jgi:fructosamine-3-kinase
LWPDVARSITEATGKAFDLVGREPVRGGCINAAWRVAASERTCFVKIGAAQSRDMFDAEAAGLAALARTGALRVPQVICAGANSEASWLVLEFIELGAGIDGRALGRGLAALHRVTAAQFGWHRDNTIGATAQPNAWSGDWIEFWRARRLDFQLALAARNGAPRSLLAKGERLSGGFSSLFCGCQVVPSLLHGDLWSGNVGADPAGVPVIFDPAVYYGHREADVAMTELFGGFDASFHAAYKDALPLDAGYRTRKHLYNLYHVLNHYNLFGGGYARQAEDLIERLLAEI